MNPPFVAFAAFGAFWGVWGAAVPRMQHQAGVDDGRLGLALLCIGAGALPAMLLAGRALDRWGPRVAAGAIGTLGVAGAGLALTTVNLASLCAGLAVVGATSGAADVAINAVAGRAEQVTGRPVITRAHGVFSTLVVLASLATGLASSLPLAVPFTAAAALALAAAVVLSRTLRPDAPGPDRSLPAGAAGPDHARTLRPGEAETGRTRPLPADVTGPESARSLPGGWRRAVPLLLVGALGALAFATENAHQSWSAVFAHVELDAGLGLSAVAPAVFAGGVAVTRFAAGAQGGGDRRREVPAVEGPG
ncbi:MFS transporter, partial [Dactylosporangium sp. NPDC005572]|uniref:MFS transporter n=1 Tax=Dactylosporangium sp. NPDC005572 TaxID=3156889 RepID=UPI0033B5657D